MGPYQTYHGGKGGNGTYHTIINHMPPHRVYVEAFLGNGAIMLRKRPAEINIGNEINPDVFRSWREWQRANGAAWLEVRNENAFALLDGLTFPGVDPDDVYVYIDAPYLKHTRKSDRNIYGAFEMETHEHEHLLELANRLPYLVGISCYENSLYADRLSRWQVIRYNATTRQGGVTELLYMNYKNPDGMLHDYSYLGKNFTDRQRIKRKIEREIARLQALDPRERNAIITAVTSRQFAARDVAQGTEPAADQRGHQAPAVAQAGRPPEQPPEQPDPDQYPFRQGTIQF